MRVVLGILRRTWCAPATLPVALAAVGLTALATFLASAALGGAEGFVAEVREGSMIFAAALFVSLAEPIEVGREARSGLLMLRRVRGGGFGLPLRALALSLAALPLLVLCTAASGGLPERPVATLLALVVICGTGVALGAFLDRRLLVPALWSAIVVAHLRPWLVAGEGAWLGVLIPDLGGLGEPLAALHALLCVGAALMLAEWRLERAVEAP